MGFLYKTKKIKDKIEYLLKIDTRTRDNDSLLIARIWHNELKNNIDNLTGLDFLKLYSENKISSAESIRRCRQKLQEENPDYRGLNYKSRKKEEIEVKHEIKNL